MKKLSTFALAIAILATGCQEQANMEAAPVSSKTEFIDMEGHWSKASVDRAVAAGYVDGYEDGTFRPEKEVTRAEFVKMVCVALGLPIRDQSSGIGWYMPYVAAAESEGIYAASDFQIGDWDTPITRKEMARMIVRATDKELKKPDVTKEDSEWMYLATKAGLIQGLSGGELGVDEATTRAQSVTVIERILTVNGGGELEVDKYAMSNAELAMSGTNIQTMWGIKAKPLPQEFDTGYSGVKGTVDRILIVDRSDENAPNYSDFLDFKTTDAGPKLDENIYIVGLHINLENTNSSDGFYMLRQSIAAFSPYRRVFINDADYPPIPGSFSLDVVDTYSGWFFMAINKDSMDKWLKEGDTLGIVLAKVNRPGVIRLTEE